MPKKFNQTWVSPMNQTHQWKIQHPGAQRASGIYDNKVNAVDAARQISQNQKTELIIQRRDGQIRQKDSHGNDPKRTKG